MIKLSIFLTNAENSIKLCKWIQHDLQTINSFAIIKLHNIKSKSDREKAKRINIMRFPTMVDELGNHHVGPANIKQYIQTRYYQITGQPQGSGTAPRAGRGPAQTPGPQSLEEEIEQYQIGILRQGGKAADGQQGPQGAMPQGRRGGKRGGRRGAGGKKKGSGFMMLDEDENDYDSIKREIDEQMTQYNRKVPRHRRTDGDNDDDYYSEDDAYDDEGAYEMDAAVPRGTARRGAPAGASSAPAQGGDYEEMYADFMKSIY